MFESPDEFDQAIFESDFEHFVDLYEEAKQLCATFDALAAYQRSIE
jgi:hypothetical protein